MYKFKQYGKNNTNPKWFVFYHVWNMNNEPVLEVLWKLHADEVYLDYLWHLFLGMVDWLAFYFDNFQELHKSIQLDSFMYHIILELNYFGDAIHVHCGEEAANSHPLFLKRVNNGLVTKDTESCWQHIMCAAVHNGKDLLHAPYI